MLAAIALALLHTPAALPERVMLISWDGAPDWVIDRLLDQGKLPNLARLARSGIRADSMIPAWPSQTAAGHAAIFTGAWSDISGISGNNVPLLPRSEHTVLERRSGFDSRGLLVDPIYIGAAKAGKKVVVLSATQAFPPETHQANLKRAGVRDDRYIQWSGFESKIDDGRVLSLKGAVEGPPVELPIPAKTVRSITFKVGETEFRASAWDDPSDPVRGYDTVSVKRVGSERAFNLKPSIAREDIKAWSPAYRVRKDTLQGQTYFRLFSLKPDGSDMELYQRASNGLVGAATEEQTREYLIAYGGFHDDPFELYQAGAFGRTIPDGGEGEAERRALELVRLDCQFLKNGTKYAFEKFKPDFVTHYTPMSDSAGHCWVGILDPESRQYKKELADKLWPYYEQVFRLQDDWLGQAIETVGPKGVVALVSDHGMQGFSKSLNVNAVLAGAGLLKYTADGKIDLATTKVMAPPWSMNCLVVNTTEWKEGIVPSGDKKTLLKEAANALLAARDPKDNMPLVKGVFTPEDMVGMGLNGPTAGDLYFDIDSNYSLSTQATTMLTSSMGLLGAGQHGYWPLRKKMQAIFFVGGAGIKVGAIPSMRQIDVAPTLCDLLGIAPLPHFQGHSVLIRG